MRAASLFFVGLLVGCGSIDPLAGDGPGDLFGPPLVGVDGGSPDPVLCSVDKMPCGADSDCCSFSCAGGSCQGGRACAEDNAHCSADADCCSGRCSGYGFCGLP